MHIKGLVFWFPKVPQLKYTTNYLIHFFSFVLECRKGKLNFWRVWGWLERLVYVIVKFVLSLRLIIVFVQFMT